MNFSVLMSVYHKESPSYFRECLDSLLHQTVMPQEIILVKDGELNPSLETVIIEYLNVLPMTVVGYKDNRGLAYALNYGLDYVSTELVARMDADDICFKSRFEIQLKEFEEYKELEVLGTGIEEFYYAKNDCLTNRRIYPEETCRQSLSLFKGTPVAHPTVMMKTNLLNQYRYQTSCTLNEDIDLWMRLLCDGHIIRTIQEPLLRFRITDNSFKRRSLKKAFSEFTIYWHALNSIHGFSVLNGLLIIRLLSRFLPFGVAKYLYFSKGRNAFFRFDNCEK